jgi:hypothetical protein
MGWFRSLAKIGWPAALKSGSAPTQWCSATTQLTIAAKGTKIAMSTSAERNGTA